MEEYPDLIAGRAQIADELRTGGLRELLARLRFDDYSVIDHHVQALARDEHAFVENARLDLALDLCPRRVSSCARAPTYAASHIPPPPK